MEIRRGHLAAAYPDEHDLLPWRHEDVLRGESTMGEPCLPQGGQLTPGVLEHPEVHVAGGQLREGCRVDVVVRQRDGGGPDLG